MALAAGGCDRNSEECRHLGKTQKWFTWNVLEALEIGLQLRAGAARGGHGGMPELRRAGPAVPFCLSGSPCSLRDQEGRARRTLGFRECARVCTCAHACVDVFNGESIASVIPMKTVIQRW